MELNGYAITGSLFIAGAVMTWLGWVLLPVKFGAYFAPEDFGKVRARFHYWIWMYRLHLFGYLVTVMAFAALAALVAVGSARVLVWPGVTVAAAGLLVTALAHAFYYHFGAWGALETKGQSESERNAYVDALKVTTEYITCWIRFGRVFFGLGTLVLAAGLLFAGTLPLWITLALAALGLAPMITTMLFPDNLEYYQPIFHLQAAWLLLAGILLILG